MGINMGTKIGLGDFCYYFQRMQRKEEIYEYIIKKYGEMQLNKCKKRGVKPGSNNKYQKQLHQECMWSKNIYLAIPY